ncbi:hypothetical protein AQJ84_04190 [Streptomyces resistomycificus]|uniref:Uncharacterized protein n=1 Tax=Streptomyces resistomycificus TaxID=67356 RepID=A0A0L8KTT3_9ACTN|nr:hypothetical protein ADK37_36990 [Streptomyces resistomycificus]KUO01644.1 hypothetical protein AQJ84_04190 [Streptomyces resistomycificus]
MRRRRSGRGGSRSSLVVTSSLVVMTTQRSVPVGDGRLAAVAPRPGHGERTERPRQAVGQIEVCLVDLVDE